MYVRNCWYVAAWDREVKVASIVSRLIAGEQVALYRQQNGLIVAMEDRCCHRFAPLSKGRIEGDAVRCMYHGMKFDAAGKCVEIPGQATIPRAARVRTYPAVEKDSWIWVWMGKPEMADTNLIPAAISLSDDRWNLRSGHLDYEANYQLLNDNLTDFSHLSYVHMNSFGAPEEFARTKPNVVRLDRGVRIWRWIDTPSRPPSSRTELPTEVDSWQTYDYLVPGILLMHSAVYSKGTADRSGRQPPDASIVPLVRRITSQAVTPMTERSTRYFFSTGTPAGEGSDAVVENMLKIVTLAFAEDKEIIEAQQRVIDRGPLRQEMLFAADTASAYMRSVIERLIESETVAPHA